jgi:two-component system phosphate regulon sensor histidine kinase PhoR
VILILVTMVGLGFYLSFSLRQSYLKTLNENLVRQTRLVADAYQLLALHGIQSDEQGTLASRWAGQTGARVTIIAANGLVLADSHEDPSGMDNHANRPEVIQALETGSGSSTRYSVTTGRQTIYTAVAVSLDSGERVVVRLSVPSEQAATNLNELQNFLTGASLLASVVAVLLAIWIASDTTRPVRQLTEVVSRLANSDLSADQIPRSIIPTNSEEISRLVQAFNLMSTRLRSQITALDIERKKNAAVLQEMTDGAVIVDEQGHIQMINHAAEEMFSVQVDHSLGRSLAEALRHHQVVELWQRCLDSQEPTNSLIEISTNRLYLQGQASPLDPFLPGNILLIFQNLTRQRYLETVRRDFISNISHELRTPLASLKALTETLQTGALEDPPAAHRFLQRMETEVDALIQMVAELLELSRIESGRVPIQFRPTRPEDIVFPAVERLRLQAERARLSLHIECPDDLPDILADSTRLEQVMVNLLHNAIKFTNPGGAITVRAYLNLKDSAPEPAVYFSVSDTGVGISSEDLPRIFERFYKTDRARSGGGTGLGLAIARHMVEAHHGRIWADSLEGQGSTFYFYIPRAN